MNLMFLDAGFAATGVVIYNTSMRDFLFAETFRSAGELDFEDVPRSEEISVRCQRLANRLDYHRRRYRITHVFAELPHGGGKSARALAAMAYVTATISTFCGLTNLPLTVISPNQIKRMVCGSIQKVSKQQVYSHVMRNLRFSESILPKTKADLEHVIDAIACFMVAKQQRLLPNDN